MSVKGDAAERGITFDVHHLLETSLEDFSPSIRYSFPKGQAKRFRNINLNILSKSNLSVEVLS